MRQIPHKDWVEIYETLPRGGPIIKDLYRD